MYSNSTFRRSNSLFQALQAIAGSSDRSTSLREIGNNLIGIKDEIRAVVDIISRVPTETPEDILLEEADEGCIEQAFVFMRTLNEIESLITDSKFLEEGKDNSAKLEEYRCETSLYTNCIAILRLKLQQDRLDSEQVERLITDFKALFNPITEAFDARAARLVDIHAFRDTILRFFAENCQTIDPEVAAIQTE